jgi:aspartate racemase
MKTLGLIGGMSWESTALYYKWINEGVRDALGPLHSAPLLLYSYDFEPIKAMQYAGDWDGAGQSLAATARRLQDAGAHAILLCTNTMHKLAPQIEAAISVPFLHLADCTAAAVVAAGHRRVALLGTKFTMLEDFYIARLRNAGLEVLVPNVTDIEAINRIIYDELCVGLVKNESRESYKQIIARLAQDGAQAVILGCTEITMLIGPQDVDIPAFDTTAIHAAAAVRFCLSS